jgi:hypothetical protein
MIQHMIESLLRLKNKLKGVDEDVPETGVEIVCDEEEFDEDDYDGEPLTWAEQKNIRKELRRFQLWHALRMKVPAAWENPQ